MNIQTAPTQSFSQHAPSFTYRISKNKKGPFNHPSHNKSYIHVLIDAFSHFVVTVTIKANNAQNPSILPPPPIDRTTKTQYNLRYQPKMDYQLFIPPSKL